MAAPSTTKTSSHVRSLSIPSRSHPPTTEVDEQLSRLRSSESASSSPLSLSSLCNKLSCLHNLYDTVEDLLQLPLTQQALATDRSRKCMEDVLDGSLRLVDMCSSTRDVLLKITEGVQNLGSSLQRQRGGEHGLANHVGEYVISMKKVNKLICKCLGDLKKMQNKHALLFSGDENLLAIICILREVEGTTISMFESLLSSVSVQRRGSKLSGWSLVSKLMNNKRVACQGEEANINEMERVEIALSSVMNKSCKGIEVEHIQNFQKQLEALELSIESVDDKLEHAFRSLIKIRVSLLNTLNH